MINQTITSRNVLEEYLDTNGMSKEEFTLSRKNTFGGSDSSVLLGVNLYKKIPELISEKQNKIITDEEMRVGELPIVKKGSDLEPFILKKAEEMLRNLQYEIEELYKPSMSFRFKDFPYLSINYDGILLQGETLIPVEAKLVSKYGEKYYKKEIDISAQMNIHTDKESEDITTHCKLKANKIGIPPYYYTQVQQEIFGLKADYGFLIAWFDDSWTGKLYYIKRDDFVIRQLILRGDELSYCLE
jgi:hypothetical protein